MQIKEEKKIVESIKITVDSRIVVNNSYFKVIGRNDDVRHVRSYDDRSQVITDTYRDIHRLQDVRFVIQDSCIKNKAILFANGSFGYEYGGYIYSLDTHKIVAKLSDYNVNIHNIVGLSIMKTFGSNLNTSKWKREKTKLPLVFRDKSPQRVYFQAKNIKIEKLRKVV